MRCLLVALAALQLLLVHAHPHFDGARIAARMQSQLRSASRSLHQRMSLEKPRMEPRFGGERRLDHAGNASTPCSVHNGTTCMIDGDWMTHLISHLAESSPVRTFFEEWEVCSVMSQTMCNTTQCQWNYEEMECSPVNHLNINAMDWFNFEGCGILSSADAAARCESAATCSSITGCAASATPSFQIGNDGMCESVTKCEYSGDMFAEACGAEFNIATLMSSCGEGMEGETNMDTIVQALITCISEACPSQSDFFNTFLTQMFACQEHDESVCGSTAGCQWDTSESTPECGAEMNSIMASTIPETCAIRDFFLTSMECEAKSTATCASTDCHLATELTCASAGVSPTSMQMCEAKPSVIFAELATGTCDDAEAQFYARGALQEEACHAATTATCASIAEVTWTCPTDSGSTDATAVAHAMGVMPSYVAGLAVLLTFFLKFYWLS